MHMPWPSAPHSMCTVHMHVPHAFSLVGMLSPLWCDSKAPRGGATTGQCTSAYAHATYHMVMLCVYQVSASPTPSRARKPEPPASYSTPKDLVRTTPTPTPNPIPNPIPNLISNPNAQGPGAQTVVSRAAP